MIEEFLSAIAKSETDGFTDDELLLINASVIGQLKFRRDQGVRNIRATLKVGDRVSFDARTRGVQEGAITKVKRKNALVNVADQSSFGRTWDVPISALTVISSVSE